MSLCSKSGEIACGTLGCRVSSRCCQADIGYGCATGASCFTNAGSIGCWWTSSAQPSGTRPCFGYADAAIGDTCGSASWCQVCSSTEYPFCYTNIILGASAPMTAVSCDAFTGITTITAAGAGAGAITNFGSMTTTTPAGSSTTTSTFRVPSRVSTPPLITPAPETPPVAAPSPSPSAALPAGAIAGIGIGAFFAVAVIALLAFFLYRKQHRAAPPPPPPPPGYGDYAAQQGYPGADGVPYNYGPKPPVVEPRYEVPG